MNQDVPVNEAESLGFDEARLRRIPEFFGSYLEKKKISGLSLLVSRGGEIALESHQGVGDWDEGTPIGPETIFRIYSMTKPVTSVALMMLFEEGRFRLEHPVGRYLPELADVQVWDFGSATTYQTRPAARPMNIRDLLTHTSGLTYQFIPNHPLSDVYGARGLFGATTGKTALPIEEMVQRLGEVPLMFDPGSQWNYSVATDVCGRLVEVLSGQTLDEFFEQRIFAPLGMKDTAFHVPDDKIDRFTTCYAKDLRNGKVVPQDRRDKSTYREAPVMLSGGGGLVSTLHDYHRFTQMLLFGGELGGARLLSPRTIDFMTQNHLEGGQSMHEMGGRLFAETMMVGTGFGLGFSVVLDPALVGTPLAEGTYSWGGAASTYFWIDPVDEVIGIIMTQFMPSDYYPMRPTFQQLVHSSITQ